MTVPPPPAGVAGEVAFASYLYYREARDVEPTPAEFAAWLDQLPECRQAHWRAKGLAACLRIVHFRRFLLEGRGLAMRTYLAQRLSPAALAFWEAYSEDSPFSDASEEPLTPGLTAT